MKNSFQQFVTYEKTLPAIFSPLAIEWSEPIEIEFTRGSCDPTLFFDEGRCYFFWKDVPTKICEIDVKTGKQLSPIKRLWSGEGGRYPEGPHIYKKDGYDYLMIAWGGTEHYNIDDIDSPTFIGRRQTQKVFSATTKVDLSKLKEGDEAGLSAYASHYNHYNVVVAKEGGWAQFDWFDYNDNK